MRPFWGAARWCVAYSGGLDSTVLLHALYSLSQNKRVPPIVAIHVHHGLQAQADQWLNHCRQQCKQWAIQLMTEVLQTQPQSHQSLEAWARAERYALIERLTKSGDVVLTAHHRTDQAETVLLQLMRGAGVQGLSAMPMRKTNAGIELVRPLLEVSRHELESYAENHGLAWVEDPSNQDCQLSRNYLRHRVLPSVAERWPSYEKTWLRSSRLLAEASDVLHEVAAEDHQRVTTVYDSCLSLSALQQLSQPRQKMVVRYHLRERQLPLPSEQQLQQVLDHVALAKPTAMPLVSWQMDGVRVQARRFRDYLYLATLNLPDLLVREPVITWQTDKPLLLFTNGSLHSTDFLQDQLQQVELRFAETGDSVKKHFQQHAVPPWWRYLLPVAYVDGQRIKSVDYSAILRQLYLG